MLRRRDVARRDGICGVSVIKVGLKTGHSNKTGIRSIVNTL